AGALDFHPAAGPEGTPRQRRADPARVHGGGIAVDTTRWVLLSHQAAPQMHAAGPELRNRQGSLHQVALSPGPHPPCPGCPTGAARGAPPAWPGVPTGLARVRYRPLPVGPSAFWELPARLRPSR